MDELRAFEKKFMEVENFPITLSIDSISIKEPISFHISEYSNKRIFSDDLAVSEIEDILLRGFLESNFTLNNPENIMYIKITLNIHDSDDSILSSVSYETGVLD